MIVSRLLGLRLGSGNIIIDPVIPYSMDDLTASLTILGYNLSLEYKVKDENFSPKLIRINGNLVPFTYQKNKYRSGGAIIPIGHFISRLTKEQNSVIIHL
jgi:cellobiose phosphorylase